MIAQTIMTAQFFEGVMLICFGASWPISISKSLRTRQVAGKSLVFMLLVFVGYLAGLSAKLAIAAVRNETPQPVSLLYFINTLLVATDICLYIRLHPKPQQS